MSNDDVTPIASLETHEDENNITILGKRKRDENHNKEKTIEDVPSELLQIILRYCCENSEHPSIHKYDFSQVLLYSQVAPLFRNCLKTDVVLLWNTSNNLYNVAFEFMHIITDQLSYQNNMNKTIKKLKRLHKIEKLHKKYMKDK